MQAGRMNSQDLNICQARPSRESDPTRGYAVSCSIAPPAMDLGIGLATAFGAARLLSPLLYGISTNDPPTMTAVALTLATIALTACYLPARKAMAWIRQWR